MDVDQIEGMEPMEQNYRDAMDEAYEHLDKALSALRRAWPNNTRVQAWTVRTNSIIEQMLSNENEGLFN